jgi:hypothetical protein
MATRNKDFPITIKAGSSAVKIYKETKPCGGKRERLTFSSVEETKTEARLKADPLGAQSTLYAGLTSRWLPWSSPRNWPEANPPKPALHHFKER